MHKGHRYLFSQLQQYAMQYNERSLLFTFLQHPRTVLAAMARAAGNSNSETDSRQPDTYCPLLLTTVSEREQLLGSFGDVHFFDFAEVQPLTALQFLDYLADRWKVRHLLMGYNHHFGSDGNLTDDQYQAIAQQVGIRIIRALPYNEGGINPSSTIIRKALTQGDVSAANKLLGYEYMLSGRVVHGRMIGRKMGFPTANIMPEAGKLIPAAGVYKALVAGADTLLLSNSDSLAAPSAKQVPALVNIGTNPTVGNTHQTIEVHIPGYAGDLYNRTLTLHFVERLRGEIRFNSIDELRAQIQIDLKSIQ